MDAGNNRALTDRVDWSSTTILVWLSLIALVAMPLLRARWSFLDSTVATKGIVGLLELLFVAAVLWRYRAKAPNLGRTASMLIAAWFIWATLAVLQADHVAAALVRHTEWVAHGLFAYALYLFLRVDAAAVRHLLRLLAAVAVLVFVEFLLFWLTLTEVGPSLQYEIPGFGNVRHLGYYALVMALLPMALAIRTEDTMAPVRADRVLAAAALTVGWCLLFWTGGRGPLLAALAGSVVLVGVRRGLTIRPFLAWSAGSAAAGFGLAALLAIPGFGAARLGARMFGAIESVEQFSSRRLSTWVEAFAESAQAPMFGLGPDGYLFLTPIGEPFMHPHAFPLQAALDWGLPGAVCAAALVIVFAYKQRRLSPMAVPAGWAAVSLLALSMIDGTLYFPYPMMIAAICVSMLAVGNGTGQPHTLTPSGLIFASIVAGACAAILSIHLTSVAQAVSVPANAGARPSLLLMFPSGMADDRAPGRLWLRLEACDASGRPDCIDIAVAAARNVRLPVARHFGDAVERMAADDPGMPAFFRERAPLLHAHGAVSQ